jgi:hypothetical protein
VSKQSGNKAIIGLGKRWLGVKSQEQRTGIPSSILRIWPGKPYPLGATWDGRGVNFALYAENATKVELCLFDSPDADGNSLGFPFRNRRTWCGMPICRILRPANSTATESTVRTIRTMATGSIPTRSWWIPMPN